MENLRYRSPMLSIVAAERNLGEWTKFIRTKWERNETEQFEEGICKYTAVNFCTIEMIGQVMYTCILIFAQICRQGGRDNLEAPG